MEWHLPQGSAGPASTPPAVPVPVARTSADPAVIHPVTRARTGGTQAQASQPALPLPQISGISIAARYRSATPGAGAGGDLYEIIPTAHGIRVIIGDVRGQGLDAALLARHVLSAFQQSAAAVPALDQLAGEISRAIRPHLGEEDFVTAALAQIAPGGSSPSSTAAITRRCCTEAASCGR